MISIDRINEMSSKLTIVGWFAGLGYYGWVRTPPIEAPGWSWLVLIAVGIFAAPIIGAGLALVAAMFTKVATGNSRGSPYGYAWMAIMAPAAAFNTAGATLGLFAAN